MKPVLNTPPAIPVGSRWEPLDGGHQFSLDLGLVIVDRIDNYTIHYHYVKCTQNFFSQDCENFYKFARRIL